MQTKSILNSYLALTKHFFITDKLNDSYSPTYDIINKSDLVLTSNTSCKLFIWYKGETETGQGQLQPARSLRLIH
jgi:hypothetical protein